jgi:sulfotransferase family protein
MPLPTMVIAGAQKCGTSSLALACRQHPQISMSERKELHFFDRNFDRGLEWYEGQFERLPQHRAVGEATPAYLYEREARERMLATLPEAKVIVVLRDPVERAYSHFWHTTRRGDEDKSFEEALELEPERIASSVLEDRARYSYVARGHYVDQLLAVVTEHDRSLLHVMLLDDVKADQAAALETLFRFLDVDPEAAQAIPEIWRNRYRVPDKDRGKALPREYPPMNPETRARLKEVFRESNDRLGEWLGRDLSAWNEV